MCAEAVRKERPTRPYPEAEPEWGLEVLHICGVRPRDLLRPGVLEPPTEIVNIFGSRVAAAEPIPHPLRLASSTSGVRDECVAGEKAKHEQTKGYTNSGTTLALEHSLQLDVNLLVARQGEFCGGEGGRLDGCVRIIRHSPLLFRDAEKILVQLVVLVHLMGNCHPILTRGQSGNGDLDRSRLCRNHNV